MPTIYRNGVKYAGIQYIQVKIIPPASLRNLGSILQYTGQTTETFIHGYFYECVFEDNEYKWISCKVQPGGDGSSNVHDFDDLSNRPEVADDLSEVISTLPSTPRASFNYSTNEQVIGTWIDGKPLYQKTYVSTALTVTTTEQNYIFETDFSDSKKLISVVGQIEWGSSDQYRPLPFINVISNNFIDVYVSVYNKNLSVVYWRASGSTSNVVVHATVQYTKTTDVVNS